MTTILSTRSRPVLVVGVAALLIVSLVATAGPSSPNAGLPLSASATWQSRVTPALLAVWKSAQTPVPNTGPQPSIPSGAPSTNSVRYDTAGRVQVDISFNCAQQPPNAQLKAAGMTLGTTVRVPPMCVIEGWVSVASIPTLALLADVTRIDLPHYRTRRNSDVLRTTPTGALASGLGAATIDGNGITIMAADQFMAQTGVMGAGVTLGIISDDVQSITVIQGRGELPAVNILQPSANPTPHSNITDEGTMMLEEVHAVAPAASLAFCGPETYPEYVACLSNLIAAGVTVVSDDLSFPGYDTMSAQSPQTQAVQKLLTSNPNVMLFTASANNQQNYWQGPYTPDNSSGASLTCNGQTDTYFENFGTTDVNVWSPGTATSSALILAWADPFGANVSNFDLYLLDTTGNPLGCAPGAGSTDTIDAFLPGAVPSPGTYFLVIGTPDASLQGKFLKLIGTGDGGAQFSVNTSGAPSSPQDFATGVATIGAVDGSDGIGANIEPYSNTGPIFLPLSAPATLQAPVVVAPDAIYVDAANTNFTSQLGSDGYFHGTSAASPNTAAVAALLRSAFPTLTPTATVTAIETGATPIPAYGAIPNGTIGYGRVNAMGALSTITGPSISGFTTATIVGGSSSTSLPVNVSGTGTLKVSISPASLIPASGVQLAPANCGSGSNGCSVVLTPILGQTGTTMVSLTVSDGANRTASYQASVTVTKPPVPTVAIMSGGSQSVQVNAQLAPVTFAVHGTGPLTVAPTTNGVSQLAISPGCGTTAMQCTATLGTAGSTPGTESLSISAADSYGQVASAKAAFNVTQPPSSGGGGGGGAIDLTSLLGLGAFGYLRRRRPRG